MFIDYRLELIIHSVILGVLMWFGGLPEYSGDDTLSDWYRGLIFIAVLAYAHFKYKGDPECNFIQSTYFFAYAAEMLAGTIGGLFVACALEGILN